MASGGSTSGNITTSNGSALLSLYATCPSGLAGANCTQATCDSLYVNPASRHPKPSGQKSCTTCTDGFTGLNCNVCGDAGACTRASALTGNRPTVQEGAWMTMQPDRKTFVLNSNELTCHRQPKAYTTVHMQCDLVQPTFSSLFPGDMVVTMTKTVNADRSDWSGVPIPANSTQEGTTLSEVWLDGDLQFYCQSTGCSSTNGTAIDNGNGHTPTSKVSDLWHCDTLSCACIPGSKVCGGGPNSSSSAAASGFALAPIINNLHGAFDVPCNYVDDLSAGDGTASCQFKAQQLVNLLGPAGVPLEKCRFGSCLLTDQLTHEWTLNNVGPVKDASQKISGRVAADIAAFAALIGLLLCLLLCGLIRRHRARFRIARRDIDPSIGLRWENVSYSLQNRQAIHAAKSKSFRPRLFPTAVRKRFEHKADDEVEYELRTHALAFGATADQGNGIATLEDAGRRRLILDNISGTVHAGYLVAILGPSGAGKTTLVELFAGREKRGKVAGNIYLQADLDQTFTEKELDPPAKDGILTQLPAVLADSSGRRLIGFVDQDDQLPPHSTVREALLFAAELSLPENVPVSVRQEGVDQVIATLGLTAVQHSLIGSHTRRGVSGGERRRVSIGVALVARPRVLILDEPLSGLDAYNAVRVIDALRSLAHKSAGATTVILTLHQPSSDIFHKFDKAIVVTEGKVLYDGAPDEALGWCAAKGRPCPPGYNVADHLLDLAFHGTSLTTPANESPDPTGKVKGSAPTDGVKRSGSIPSSSRGSVQAVGLGGPSTPQLRVATSRMTNIDIKAANASSRHHSSTVWFTQFAALLRRHFVTLTRDSTGPIAHLALHVIIGLVAGGAFFHVADTIGGFQNRIGSIYFTYLMMAFGSMSAITHLAAGRSLMIRERANRFYSSHIWLAAHALYDLIFWRLVPGFIMVVIIYFMVGLRTGAEYFFEFLLIAEVFYSVTTLYMMILSAACEEMSVAVLMGGAFILFNIGLGGFLLNLSTLPGVIKWVQWLCPLKYALEGVAINEVANLQIKDQLEGVAVAIPATLIAPGLFGLTGTYYRDLLVLALAWLPGLSAILTVVAWWRLRDRR